jgi:hypothetical protein
MTRCLGSRQFTLEPSFARTPRFSTSCHPSPLTLVNMNKAAQRQYEKAIESLTVAEEELESALNRQADPRDSGGRWARVRALQAQAQLHILHSISHDLEAISDAIDTTT